MTAHSDRYLYHIYAFRRSFACYIILPTKMHFRCATMGFLYRLRRRLTLSLANNSERMDELPPLYHTTLPVFSFGQSPITRSSDIGPKIPVPPEQEHRNPRNGSTTSFPEVHSPSKVAGDPVSGQADLKPRSAHTIPGLLKTKARFSKLLAGRRTGLTAPREKDIDRALKIKWELGNEVRYNRHRDLWRRVDREGWQTRSNL